MNHINVFSVVKLFKLKGWKMHSKHPIKINKINKIARLKLENLCFNLEILKVKKFNMMTFKGETYNMTTTLSYNTYFSYVIQLPKCVINANEYFAVATR